MTRFSAPIAEQIWDMKYRFKDADGSPIDVTVEDTWRRIARSLAEVEDNPSEWEETFYDALADFKYLPAGRITAGSVPVLDLTWAIVLYAPASSKPDLAKVSGFASAAFTL